MRFTFLIPVLVFAFFVSPGFAQDAKFSVGEKWVFAHEGPRPWRPPTEPVNGDRTREVLSTAEKGGKTTWKVRETWGRYDNSPTTWTIGPLGNATALTMGTNRVTITPPMPVRLINLAPGETVDYEGDMKITGSGNNFRMAVNMTREADQTVEVPAGTYEDCIYVKGTTTLKISMGGQDLEFEAGHEIWFHPSVNGLVKEVYSYKELTLGNQTSPAFSCVSTLKSYTKAAE